MTNVAVVILNYNGLAFLKAFLPSVLAHSSNAQIYVADNASTDQSLAFVRTHFPAVQLIALAQNRGYAQGYNEALAQIKAKYYVLLNSDIEVTPRWLEPMFALLESNAQIAACQPKIKDFNRQTHFEYAGAAGGYLDKWGYPFCRGRLFDSIEEDQGQYDDTREVFWATGACMFIRAAAFWEVGGFDGLFFAHMEEIDLCWRLQASGHRVFYCGEATIYHVGGGTLHKSNPFKTYLNFRNGLAMLYKNLPTTQVFWVILWRLTLDGLAGLQLLWATGWKDCWAVVQAHGGFYKRLGAWHRQRKAIARKKTVQLYAHSIVWAYFAKKQRKFSDLPSTKKG